jgi:hypothetical protein
MSELHSGKENELPKGDMTTRRSPVDTVLPSTVIYPSALFSLEKDEVFPYERFAYNLLHEAVAKLKSKQLPERIVVDFTQLLPGSFPWSINSSIKIERDGNELPVAFQFLTPELVPSILYLFAATVASDLLDNQRFERMQENPKILAEQIHLFVDAGNAGVRAYQEKGFGSAIRASYLHLGLEIWDLDRCANHYDWLAKLIVNHEIAHAYVQQVTHRPHPTVNESMAFELIADMVATAWFYSKMIGSTPDTAEYRKFRGMQSYAETILANALGTLRCQQALLVLMAIAGAQTTGGQASLAGGRTHPAGLQRHMLQHLQLYTLIRSNFSSVLSDEQFRQIDADWDLRRDMLVRCGVIQAADLEGLLDPSDYDAIEVAAGLIEELGIIELEKLVPFLREIREKISDASHDRSKTS